ncbi:hypothetical protein PP182_06320 [Maribacter sp. PR1]|uniref:Uncharacterized protein n=1 Tax=Maribacter cobaltidurans TaxID=1178778 RepID=A0ABU7IT15_9FLAO|nr:MULTISPECIES: hypothetical protein [Maribacter]MDC6388287.1 hypothetical protein [Maribacter sp. PR1]MEE1975676.1 hypothetical protein [Maribacter cobaltidurans]
MKKIGLGVGIIILVLILLTYFSISSTDKEFTTCIVKTTEDLESFDFSKHDSVTISPSMLYKANPIKTIIQGEQYREAWSTPVNFPIVYLDTLFGGVEILEEGGGKQTHSLKLKSKEGYIYTLRSINKDPKPLIPEWAKTLGLENIIVDGISAQHPFSALAVARLADKANLIHTQPRAVFIPQQKSLGKYNENYGNRIYLLEHETEGGRNWIPYQGVEEIIDTDDLQELKVDLGSDLKIDRKTLIRARLFDIIIGDWDRHSKQWGWAVTKKERSYTAVPIAGDRDNAFFNIGGLIPTIISNRHLLPGLQSFEKDIDYLPGLVMPFDVYFLKNSSKKEFLTEAEKLQSMLTDRMIANSFKVWPEQLYKLDAKEIIGNIQSRKKNLPQIAEDFYEILTEKEYLNTPLKGSEDLGLPSPLIRCFDCL